MGHSLGGLPAQEFAVHYPASCRGLVLLNSTAAIDESWKADEEARAEARRDEPWFPAAHAALGSGEDITSDAAFKTYLGTILPFYFHDVAKYDPAAFASESYAIQAYTMMHVNEAALERGALDRLGEVDVPSVIVTGDDDFICSAVQATRIHLRLKGSKLVVIERAGHFPWLEQPDAFHTLLEAALRGVGALSAEITARPARQTSPVDSPDYRESVASARGHTSGRTG